MRGFVVMLGGVALPGCVERLVYDVDCGDGVAVRGEACFGDERERLAVGFTPVATRVADFDGDDDQDVLVLGVDVDGVAGAMFRGDDGNLAAPIDAGVHGCSAHPALGDADHDGATDLLVATCDSSMLVFPSAKDGTFAPPIAVDLGVLPRTSALVDVDGDGNTDVVALGTVADATVLAWARGTSPSSWNMPSAAVLGTVGHPDDPTGFSIGQLDDGDHADAVLSHASPDAPPLLSRGEPGGFGVPEPIDELPPSVGVSVANVDGRGADELFVLTDGGATLEVWRGRIGDLERIGRTDIGAAQGRLLAVGDIDGDARLDLAFFSPDSPRVDLWLADRSWGWRETGSVDVGAPVDQLAIADLDGDRAAELVAGTFADGGVTIVRSDP